MERRALYLPRRERAGRGRQRTEAALWRARRRCRGAPGARQADAQGRVDVHDRRHAHEAARLDRQGDRRRRVRDGREGPGRPRGGGGALSGVRGKGGARGRRRSEGRARRAPRGTDRIGRGRRRRRLLARAQGAGGPEHHVGRRGHRVGCRRDDRPRFPRGGQEERRRRAQRRKRRRRDGARCEDDRRRIRSALPRARHDGAHELHGARARGRRRCVGAHAVPDGGAGNGGDDRRRRPRGREDSHDLPRRRIRSSRRDGCRRRRRPAVEGHRRTGEGDLVA